MPSLVWTADKYFKSAIAPLSELNRIQLAWVQRFDLIGRVQSRVVAAFYTALAPSYMKTASPSLTGDTIDMSALSVMRSGDQVRMMLESTVSTDILPVTLEELQLFQTTDPRHPNAIRWCYSGNKMFLKKSGSSYGTLTLHYPAPPQVPTTGTDAIDLPDGPACDIGLTMLRNLVDKDYIGTGIDRRPEIMDGVKAMLQNYGMELSKEDMKKKVESLS